MSRVRFIPQLETAECGAACLAMVLEHHGRSVSLTALREECGVSRDGVSALNVVRAARAHGLDAKGLRTTLPGLRSVALPAILHWEFKHFVVLEQLGSRSAMIVDPAAGRRKVSATELGQAFTGVVITLRPAPGFQKRRKADTGLRRYFPQLRRLWPTLVRLMIAALLLDLLGVVVPAGTQLLVDHVLRPQRDNWLVPLTLALGAAGLARIALRSLRERAQLLVQFSLDVTLLAEFVHKLADLPMGFFEQRSPGDLMQRVDANLTIRDLSQQVVTAVLDGLLLLSFGGLMLAYEPRLALLVMALSSMRMWLVIAFRSRLEQVVAAELVHAARERSVLVEATSAPETVRALGMQTRLLDKFTDRLTDRLNAQMSRDALRSAVGQAAVCWDQASLAAVFWLGGQWVLAEQMSLGVLTGFIALQSFLRGPLDGLVAAYQQREQARGILHRTGEVLSMETPRRGTIAPGRLLGHVEFSNVAYRHARRGEWLLEGVSFQLRAGERAAFLGRSGQGKSTLLRLFLGLVEAEQGSVRIDGMDLTTLSPEALQSAIGVVLQETFFFDGTVHENIAFGRSSVGEADVRWAARMACIDDAIEALPQGYYTPLTANAARLSGGQRQRLALARALAGRPSILVLDEATSALDLETETRVAANLRQLGCTQLLVAHRLNTVRDVDRVFMVAAGRVTAQGAVSMPSRRAPAASLGVHGAQRE